MRAVLLSAYGEGGAFSVGEVETPVTGDGEVRIRVRAVSVNPADTKIRAHGGAIAPKLPAILGMDVAGEVVEVGANVTDFVVGDRVYGCVGGLGALQGTLAEYVCADVRLLAKMPMSLSFREAAALPLVVLSAWEGLFDKARLATGQRVLVYGATGGVGHLVVQLAKLRGAHVTATVSGADKAALARTLGADEVVRRDEPDFDDRLAACGQGFDVVFDTVGGDNLNHAIRMAALYGQVVTLVARQAYALGDAMNKALSLHIVFMLVRMMHDYGRAHHGHILREVAAMVDAGTVRPLLDGRQYGVGDTHDAFVRVATGAAVGKVVIDVVWE